MARVYRKGKFTRGCLGCGVLFSTRISWSHVKYCSKSCWTRTRTGDKNSNWKGGLTEADQQERNRFNREIRPLVFQRDGYTCQVCLVEGGYLQVDHIERWVDRPELRFELDNCRTVCRPCHYYVTFKRKMPQGSKWGMIKQETGIKDLQ